MKQIKWHKKVVKELEKLDFTLKKQLLEAVVRLANGENLNMPLSRPMPDICHGAHELRLKDGNGQYRVFYFLKRNDGIFIFHFFKKKQQKTPLNEVRTGKIRLREML